MTLRCGTSVHLDCLPPDQVCGCGERQVGGAAMVFSGVVEGRVKGGVVIMISEELRGCVKEWKCESERLMKVRLQIDGRWVTLVQV